MYSNDRAKISPGFDGELFTRSDKKGLCVMNRNARLTRAVTGSWETPEGFNAAIAQIMQEAASPVKIPQAGEPE
jgi:hypothetical protein